MVIVRILGLIALLLQLPAFAAVTAQLDRGVINVNDTFQLLLESRDGDSGDQPDLTPLEQDFEVLGTSQSSRFEISNGQSSSSKQWSITLSAKHEGQLEIPAIQLGNSRSQPLFIKVLPEEQSVAGQEKPVFIEATIDKTRPYVQEQVVLTIKLYHNVPIANGSLSNPDVKETAIERLGNDHTYRADKNGQNYEVIERRFALFPQRSGSLTIPPIVFEGAIPDPRNPNRFGGGILNDPFNLLQTNRPTKTRSEPLTLDVKAIPPSEANHPWLPAEALTVEESWSQGSNDLQVGVPVTRTVTIRAKGLSVAQLPKIALPEFPSINSYPDKSAESNDAQPDGITGISQQKIAVIPSHPGDITLPEIRIPWWNIKTQQREEALIPARTLHILPAANQTTSPTAATPLPSIAPVETAVPAIATPPPTTPPTTPGYWPWATLLAVTAWLITLALWLRDRHRTKPVAATAPNNTHQHSLKTLQQEITTACQQHDPQQTKTTLLNWATQQWPHQPPRSLGELKTHLQSEPAKSEIDILEAHLYHPEATRWQGDELQKTLNDEWRLTKQVVRQEGDGLEGLYPR